MSTRPTAILFDLDGTLIDTAPDFHCVINQLLIEEQRPTVSYEFLRHYVSNGARAMVEAAFNATENTTDFDRLHAQMLELYLQHLDVESQLFPGLENCLAWLEELDIPWGVVTNKPELYTTPLMRGLGLINNASCIICPDHVSEKKPHPESLFLACQQINCAPEQAVYVGDHIRDIEAGRRAGMLTIGATYGYLNQQEDPHSWQADHYIDHAAALKPLLQSIYSL